jgi:ABC-type transport system involved in multi-copper enzyme maturation permease subunit
MNALKESWAVFAHELRRSLRSAKTLALLILYSLAALLGGLVFVLLTRQVQAGLSSLSGGQELPPEALAQMRLGALAAFFGKDEALLQALADVPMIILFFFKVGLFFLPLLVVLMGFDQISGELQSRSLRFVTLRASRGALLAGKIGAQVAVLAGLTAIINLMLLVFAAATTEGFALGAGTLSVVKFWLVEVIFGLAYIGLTAMCSALFRTPIFSLLTALCLLFVFWLFAVVSSFDSLAFLSHLAPSHYKDGLVSPDLLTALGSVGAYIGFAALFVGVAWFSLRSRDV